MQSMNVEMYMQKRMSVNLVIHGINRFIQTNANNFVIKERLNHLYDVIYNVNIFYEALRQFSSS